MAFTRQADGDYVVARNRFYVVSATLQLTGRLTLKSIYSVRQFLIFAISGLLIAISSGYSSAEERPIVKTGFSKTILREVIADRPAMGNLWKKSKCFRCTVAGLVAAKGCFLAWDNTEPMSGRPSEVDVYSSASIAIRISSSDKLDGADLWFAFVFEVNNASNQERFANLDEKAAQRQISSDEFVNSCVELELLAVVQTVEFFGQYEACSGETFGSELYAGMKQIKSSSVEDYFRLLDTSDENGFDPRDYYRSTFGRIQRTSFAPRLLRFQSALEGLFVKATNGDGFRAQKQRVADKKDEKVSGTFLEAESKGSSLLEESKGSGLLD